MILNHLSMSVRSIVKQRLYSTINIVGLAAGLAITVLIILFVNHENSFDKNIDGYENVYRLNWESNSSGARFATFLCTPSKLMRPFKVFA